MAQVQRLVAELPAPQEPPKALRGELAGMLGVGSVGSLPTARRGQRRVEGGAVVERLDVPMEVTIPMLRVGPPDGVKAVLLATADGGKESLLHHASIRAAVEAGMTIVAVDGRGTGELALTKPGFVFATSLMLGENFVGRQAQDLINVRRALARLPEFKDKPIGLLGSGAYMAQAALYAAVLDEQFAWLATEGGFVSFRSYLDRPQALRASYRLAPSFAAAWDGIDQEIPAPLFVFDVLRRLDLSDLYASLAPRPVLIGRPIDGERQPLSADAASQLLRGGRYRWPAVPAVAVGDAAGEKVRSFLVERTK
jgi:hypothetical protein